MNPHLFIIHFPVAFILLAAVVDLLGSALKNPSLREWGWRLLMTGALAAFLSFATGESARMAALGDGLTETAAMETHELWGSAGIWGLAIAALLRTLWRHRTEGLYLFLNTIVVLGAAGIILTITILGTMIRHG